MGVIDAVLQEERVKAGMKLRGDQMRIGGYGEARAEAAAAASGCLD